MNFKFFFYFVLTKCFKNILESIIDKIDFRHQYIHYIRKLLSHNINAGNQQKNALITDIKNIKNTQKIIK